MQVLFISRSRASDELRDATVRRVRFALRRMTWLVPRASIHLSDTNGPRGGIDKRCQVQFKTDRTGTVVVTSVARDWREAVDGALARATRLLLRLWRRSRDPRASDRRVKPHRV